MPGARLRQRDTPRAPTAVRTPRRHRFRGRNGMKRCRPRVRWRSSELDAQPPGRTGTLTGRTKSAQTLDQHRVGRKGDRTVDQHVEHLVVPGGAHVEELADRLFLGAGVLPPLALEGDDLAVALTQLAQRDCLDLCCGVHVVLRIAWRSSPMVAAE